MAVYFTPCCSSNLPLLHTSGLFLWCNTFIAPSFLLCHLRFLCVLLSCFLVSSGPSLWPFAASRWARLQETVLLALKRRYKISIWTTEANQAAEMKQEKLRCLKAFGNKEQKHYNRDAERWWEQVLLGGSVYVLLQQSLLLLADDCGKMLPDPEVPWKETAFTVAAVVYNSLWSRLNCDTSRLSPLRLLGIWIMKEQCLKSAFSFSTSSISCLSKLRAFVFQLQKFRSLKPEGAWSVSNRRIKILTSALELD